MKALSNSLMLKFAAEDTNFEVTRRTLRRLAKELAIPETLVVHIALSRLAVEILPAYELDDGPLTGEQIAAIRKDVAIHQPRGKLLHRQTLFA